MSCFRSSLLLAALFSVGVHAPAQAVPLFFEGNLGVGFDATNADVLSLGIDILVDDTHTFEAAGDPALIADPDPIPLLSVSTSKVGEPFVPALPSFADPILATVLYTVTNTTGAVLDDEHLVFTLASVSGHPNVDPSEFAIDVPNLVLVQTPSCVGNALGPCVFGAVLLPLMNPGDVYQFQIVHLVADDLAGPNSTVVPSPALAYLNHTASPPSVPEPSFGALLLTGLAALGIRRRV